MNPREQIEKINAAMSRTNELYGRWAKKQGMNYNSLMILYAMDTVEQCTQKKICEEWLIPKQTVSSILKELEIKGYVRFETDSRDKREKILFFTKEGQAYADPVLKKLYRLEENVIARMGEEISQAFVTGNLQYCEFFELEVEHEK